MNEYSTGDAQPAEPRRNRSLLRVIGERVARIFDAQKLDFDNNIDYLIENQTTVHDNGETKVLRIIPAQEGIIDIASLLPRQEGEEALFSYIDGNTLGDAYFIRCDSRNEDGRPLPVTYRIRPEMNHLDEGEQPGVLSGGYIVSIVDLRDFTLGIDDEGLQMVSLSGRRYNGLDHRLNAIYRLEAATQGGAATGQLEYPDSSLPATYRMYRQKVDEALGKLP